MIHSVATAFALTHLLNNIGVMTHGMHKQEQVERQACCMQVDEAAAVMTQLPPDRACLPRVSLACGDALESFTVQAHDSCGARAGSSDSLACSLQVICEGLDPSKASFPISAAGVAVVEGGRSSPAHCPVLGNRTGPRAVHVRAMRVVRTQPCDSLAYPANYLQEPGSFGGVLLYQSSRLSRRRRVGKLVIKETCAYQHGMLSLGHTAAGASAQAAIAAVAMQPLTTPRLIICAPMQPCAAGSPRRMHPDCMWGLLLQA